MATKKEGIIQLWKDGERDVKVIAKKVSSTVESVRVVLSTSGLTKSPNARKPILKQQIIELYSQGTKRVSKISEITGACHQYIYEVIKKNELVIDCNADFSRQHCRIPFAIIEEAENRNLDPNVFAEKLLWVIGIDDLYNAILEE